ncbi:MAG TPA: enoyl-CoA hydratase-related protein, partial [Novosphingobium sp.]|nr:enoyl-CoA hydratase-related protein [Novosphingobium sp.]
PAAALRALTKPVVAAIDGPCITGALEMALSCDIAIATPAARFADTHCQLGLFPRWGGGTLLPSAIGVWRARQMMLTGAPIDAGTALAWGLVNELVPAPGLLARAAELAQAMAQLAGARPQAFALHAELLDTLALPPPARALEADLLARFDLARFDLA